MSWNLLVQKTMMNFIKWRYKMFDKKKKVKIKLGKRFKRRINDQSDQELFAMRTGANANRLLTQIWKEIHRKYDDEYDLSEATVNTKGILTAREK